jgi:hypothetical protein
LPLTFFATDVATIICSLGTWESFDIRSGWLEPIANLHIWMYYSNGRQKAVLRIRFFNLDEKNRPYWFSRTRLVQVDKT